MLSVILVAQHAFIIATASNQDINSPYCGLRKDWKGANLNYFTINHEENEEIKSLSNQDYLKLSKTGFHTVI